MIKALRCGNHCAVQFPLFINRRSVSASLSLATTLLAVSPSFAAQWQNNVSYGGSGPTMDLYVPDAVDASPGIVVALHYCSGNSGATHGWFQSLADQHGFIVISPSVGGGKNCWDATPQRSGERAAIVQMVNYAIDKEGADRARVFAAGASSGACMTNVLLAAYPDVFAGGALLAGVPAGAWMGGNQCGICNQAAANKTPQAWGDIVRNAFAFTGTRPKVQLFHGTADNTLNYGYLAEEVEQWTNVLGLDQGDGTMETGKPKSGWNRTSYKNDAGDVVLEVNIGQGVGHDLTGQGFYGDIVRFFALDQDAPATTSAAGTGGAGAAGTGGAGGAGNGGGEATAGSGGDGAGEPGAGGAAAATTGGSTVASSGATGTSGSSGSAAATGGSTVATGGSDTGDGDSEESSGCSFAGARSGSFGALAAAALGAVALLRRRRNRRA